MTVPTESQQPVLDAAELVRQFHVFDPGPSGDIYDSFRRLQDGCPVGRSELFGGYWVVTRQADIEAILRTPEVFSSEYVTIPPHTDPLGRAIPHQQDPPEHAKYRHDLQKMFSPTAAAAIEAGTRQRAKDMLGAIVRRGYTDFATEFCDPFPGITFLLTLGLPVNSLPALSYWKHAMIHEGMGPDPDKRAFAAEVIRPTVNTFFQCAIEQRRKLGTDAPDDVLTGLTRAKFDDRLWTEDEILRCIHLVMNAGLDTVAGVLGLTFAYLAENPGARQELIDNRGLVPAAVEEFLRYFSNVTTARVVTQDTEIAGKPMKQGDLVLLPTPAAGRDQHEHGAEANRVDFHRGATRHLAFGVGPHRCLGSHLGRMELRIALEEALELMPHFEIAPQQAARPRWGLIFGMESLPLVIRT